MHYRHRNQLKITTSNGVCIWILLQHWCSSAVAKEYITKSGLRMKINSEHDTVSMLLRDEHAL